MLGSTLGFACEGGQFDEGVIFASLHDFESADGAAGATAVASPG